MTVRKYAAEEVDLEPIADTIPDAEDDVDESETLLDDDDVLNIKSSPLVNPFEIYFIKLCTGPPRRVLRRNCLLPRILQNLPDSAKSGKRTWLVISNRHGRFPHKRRNHQTSHKALRKMYRQTVLQLSADVQPSPQRSVLKSLRDPPYSASWKPTSRPNRVRPLTYTGAPSYTNRTASSTRLCVCTARRFD